MNLNGIRSLFKKQKIDPIKILGVRQENGKIFVKISITRKYYEYLYHFLKEKGLIGLTGGKDGISLLLEYGLTDLTPEDLSKQWDIQKMSRYAAACFKCYELFEKNCAIAAGLKFHLLENKNLKKKLREKGMDHEVTEDEWDNWDQTRIKEFYDRYVFCR